MEEIPARGPEITPSAGAPMNRAGGPPHYNSNSAEDKRNGVLSKYLFAVWQILEIIIIASIIVFPIRYFLFQPFIVKGESMVPNFYSSDYLIVDELTYRFADPKRGDIVVLKYPLDASQRYIKRIVGLPGETIDIKNGVVSISKDGNIFVLDESAYLPPSTYTDGNIHLALGNEKYFVMGDNRRFSYDSRRWGALPRGDVIGRAVFRLYPFRNVSYISAPSYY